MSDERILAMISKNNCKGWSCLYDKYGAMMLGVVCNLTDDDTLAEDILTEAFTQLKEKQVLSEVRHALCGVLLRHTFACATQQLKLRGISPKSLNLPRAVKLIHLLSTSCSSLKEVAFVLEKTEEETGKEVRAEFLNLRNPNRFVAKVVHHAARSVEMRYVYKI